MHVQFHSTTVVNDTHYIDLLSIDGVLWTMLMHKIAEPNEFGILKQEQGDAVSTIASDLVLS